MSADNQQERLENAFGHYIAGFVDGEGTFHIAIQKTRNVRVGYQLIPEFRISQRSDRTQLLREIQKELNCGYIKENHARKKNDNNHVLTVRNRNDLYNKVIPFFLKYPLRSGKRADFKKFSHIVHSMVKGRHLTFDGLKELLDIALSMNRGGQYRTVHKASNIF